MKKRGNFVTYQQLNIMDCGPTCLRMVAKYHGSQVDINTIRRNAGFNKGGVSLLGISDAAENIGFRTRAVQVTQDQLIKQVPHPCILHWEQNHFVVLPPLKTSWFTRTSILIADPAKGLIRYSNEEFRKYWISSVNEMGTGIGTVLILEPTALNYDSGEINGVHKWSLPINYLKRNIRSITQVILSLLVASVFQLIIPLLTQSIIDTGINTQNIQYISLVLLAQLMLIFSRTIVDFVRGRILLFVSININVSLLSDFWIKLTRLPMSYFDSYHLGDTLQRLEDSKSIERFMTSNAISSFFSIFTFFIFSFVLALYSTTVLSVFIIGGALYFLWISFFLKFRRKVNYQLFSLSAKENVASLQMIQGMQELKLNNAEKLKRWEWENIQASVFKLSLKNLSYSQLQQAGAIFINEGKNVIIIFLVAQLVIEGRLTLGAMLAIQYIIGQLNSPIEQFIGFLQAFQDAKISMERLNEIHGLPEENTPDIILSGNEIMPINKSVILKNVSFSYPGIDQEPILSQINLLIEEGKTTAIVGVSGSGKTTLLKLLLKFYDSYKGEIQIGKEASINSPNNLINFSNINPAFWRSQCGAVLQDGFIFNDTI
ncbi:MAG: ATP-binding cassette domain-containing protein, partial [Chitinophagaceae bacterium]|nr:ATP-binding cassette domain-containing protein [Chitinophagaceae bacterium]